MDSTISTNEGIRNRYTGDKIAMPVGCPYGTVRAIVEWCAEKGADLRRADLRGVNFTGASLDGVDLIGADLTGAVLDGASLDGAVLDRATLDDAVLDEASLIEASLVHASFIGASLGSADFTGADLEGARLRNTDLVGVDFVGADLRGVDFTGAALDGVDFTGANLAGANLAGAVNAHIVRSASPAAVLSADWAGAPDHLVVECLVHDAANHDTPSRFREWAGGGAWPFQGENYDGIVGGMGSVERHRRIAAAHIESIIRRAADGDAWTARRLSMELIRGCCVNTHQGEEFEAALERLGVEAPWGRCDGSTPDIEGCCECGARHEGDDRGTSLEEEINDHTCSGCGVYTPGNLTLAGGLCPRCSGEED